MIITDKKLTLENEKVKLRFFLNEDLMEFNKIFDDNDIWKYTVSKVQTESEISDYFEQSLSEFNSGFKYTFVIIDKSSGRIAGSSSYGNISEYDSRLEIGWSYLGTDFWGKGINSNFKYLMLQYAFETLKMKRVEFKTDYLNARARKALLKIGCTEEGVLRSHTLLHTGRRRDAVYYSILDNEWDNVKTSFFKGIY